MSKLSFNRLLRIWWSFFWRFTLVGFLAGFVLGAIAGGILGAMGRPNLIPIVAGWLGTLVSIPVGVWALMSVFSIKYKEFDIIVVDRKEQQAEAFD